MGDILVAYGKSRVTGVKEFQKQVAATDPGKAVTLEFLRDGKRAAATLTVEEAEGQSENRRPPRKEAVDPLGMSVSAVPPRLLREMELKGGVEVTFVEASTPAWESGIREGDILLALNREAVPGVDAYRKAISRLRRGVAVSALVYRDGVQLFVAVRHK